jgi:molybdate transport system permease protein
LVLPPVVTGYVLLLLLGRRGPLGQFLDEHFGIVFAFRWTGAALACAVMGFPLMVRAIRLSIEAVDQRLEEAAAAFGASPFWAFLIITLPLALPGVIAGMILSFRPQHGRVRRHDHFRIKNPGRDPDTPHFDLHLEPNPGWRCGRAPADLEYRSRFRCWR